MKLKFFRAVRRPGDWEINFIGKRLNLRIARAQFAFWRDNVPLWDMRFSSIGAG